MPFGLIPCNGELDEFLLFAFHKTGTEPNSLLSNGSLKTFFYD
jgi:hypothetical protein